MKTLTPNVSKRVFEKRQTRANNSQIDTSLWIARSETPLKYPELLEKQTISRIGTTVTGISVATKRTGLGKRDEESYISYVADGTLRIKKSIIKYRKASFSWRDIPFTKENAVKTAIAFDGTMPKYRTDETQFVTDAGPWIFWTTTSGECKAQRLYTEEEILLANENCTAISAIRAFWSEAGDFDYGLVIFMLLDGMLYYRQYIRGEWKDHELVSFRTKFGLDTEPSFIDIRANRTWDYHIIVQLKKTDGTIVELESEFMGIAKNISEHMDIHADYSGEFTEISRMVTRAEDEHMAVESSYTRNMIYGLSSVPTNVINVSNGSGNYGLYIEVSMDYPISWEGNKETYFTLVDDRGINIRCTSANLKNDRTIRLGFVDFNFIGTHYLTLRYNGEGNIMSPATTTDAFEETFLPVNLTGPTEPAPVVEEVTNI